MNTQQGWDRIPNTKFALAGVIGDYLNAVTEQWLLVAPDANPGMLEIFRDRDRKPYRELVPWAGEFAGKYLTGAVQVWRVTRNDRLLEYLKRFVGELLTLQADDGYFGPWPASARLTNKVNYPDRTHYVWDAWGHYHMMLGLLLWHEESGDQQALAAVVRIGDLICKNYLGKKTPRLCETGSTEMNLAPIHSLVLLYQKTGTKQYLEMACQIADEFSARDEAGQFLTGDYLNGPLAGKEFFELPRPRWESLHPIMGLAELYRSTGKEEYRAAFVRIWHSIRKSDRHNNGGFSSGEKATGNPFDPGAIETCCTIAWNALSVEMLRLTGDSLVADELELTLFNSITGMHSPSGRWATYDTPMNGVKRASAHSIVFQSREGTPELNCCSVNSNRGFGMLSDWALMEKDQQLFLNYYGAGRMTADLKNGHSLGLEMKTEYPFGNRVEITVSVDSEFDLTLLLRIPGWSHSTNVTLNGKSVPGALPGHYLPLHRNFKNGDKLVVEFDFSLHYWLGQSECDGQVSVYRGPVLLCYDRRYNDLDPDSLPILNPAGLEVKPVAWGNWLPPRALFELTGADGRRVRLCDFASAGNGGSPYQSWLPVTNGVKDCFQPYAAKESDYLQLKLLRFNVRYQQFLADKSAFDQGQTWRTALSLFTESKQLSQRYTEFLKTADEIRCLIAAQPEKEEAKQLKATLSRIEKETGFTSAQMKEQLECLPREIQKQYEIPVSSVEFFCSGLQEPVRNIADAKLPAPQMPYEPVKNINGESFCDIRSFHQNQHGILYIKTSIHSDQVEDGTFEYGADGPVKVWINDIETDCHPEATNPASASSFKIKTAWKKGNNKIIFALSTNQGRAWGVFAARSP